MSAMIVGFSGHARSGKTSLAEAVSRHTGLPVGRFGKEVERVAADRGLPLEPAEVRRSTLMTLGEELVAEDAAAFCRRVLDQAAWAPGRSALLDGIRHVAVVEALRDLVRPTPLRVVFVRTPPALRESRLAVEGLIGSVAREQLDAHSTEREMDGALPALAALTVDGEGDVERGATTVLAAMRAWGWHP